MHLTVDPVRQMYAETLQNTAKSSSGLLGNAAASIEVGLLDAELCARPAHHEVDIVPLIDQI